MTPPEFSVLLLAWDDADPSVAVLGGAALPPTLPLVYQLAAQQPVLAVYPHLPAGEESADNASAVVETAPITTPVAAAPQAPAIETVAAEETIDAVAPEEPKGALDTAVALPGVQLLPGPAATVGKASGVAEAAFSRIVGLADLTPASSPALTAAEPVAALVIDETRTAEESMAAPVAVSARSQWPAGTVLSQRWLAPAAPYLGAGSGEGFPPPPPAPPHPAAARRETVSAVLPGENPQPVTTESAAVAATEEDEEAVAAEEETAAPQATEPTAALQPREQLLAGDLNFDPDPELPPMSLPLALDEPTEEVGAAEAYDISAPEDDITLDAPTVPVAAGRAAVPAATAQPVATPRAEPAGPVALMPAMDGLNFRMIQYSRQAAQLVRGRSDFTIIYAPNWPAWLAALELRNSTGKPLVLYVASLAADFAAPAERGWLLEIERMTLRRATLILVPDPATEKQLRKHYADTIEGGRVVLAADEDAVQQHLSELALATL